MDHLGAEHPVIAVGGVDVKSAARPGHRTDDEKCGRLHFCLPSTHSRIASADGLRCTAMVVVVPAGARRRQRRGRHDLAGEGRVAGEQRTTPSSPCAIQLIASRGVSLSAFSCAGPPSFWSHSVWSPSAVHVSSAVCGKSSSSAEPWRGNSLAAVVRQPPQPSRRSSALGSVTKCGGRKSYDQRGKSRSKYFIFFGHFSRRCQLRTSRTCSKVNSRYVRSYLSFIHPSSTHAHCARGSRQTRGRCDSERWPPGLSSPVCCDTLKGVPNLCLKEGVSAE